MGIAYYCDKNNGITYEIWVGVVTGAEWVEHVRRQVADPNWPAGNRSLTDLRLLSEGSSIDKTALKQVASIYRAHSKRIATGKAAVVAEKWFQTSPLFGIFASRHGLRVIVFNDIRTACKWIGIDVSEAERLIQRLQARMVSERYPSDGGAVQHQTKKQ